MKQDEVSNHKSKKDRHWNQLYWAHITVFVGFTVLIAWVIYAFSPSFSQRRAAIRPVATASLPALSIKGHPQQETRAKARGNDINTMQSSPVPTQAAERARWSSGDIVSAMSSFYTTVIAILVALIGIMGVLAGFTLRALSRASAEETAHEQANIAMTHYISSRKFAREVEIAVEEAGITVPMERLEQEMDKIRRLLVKRSSSGSEVGSEDIDGQVEPQAPGPEQL